MERKSATTQIANKSGLDVASSALASTRQVQTEDIDAVWSATITARFLVPSGYLKGENNMLRSRKDI